MDVLCGQRNSVSDLVANKRHVGVDESGTNQPPRFSGPYTFFAVIAENLPNSCLGPKVHPAMVAFASRADHFAQAVRVIDAAAKRPVDNLTLMRVERFGV